MGKGEREDGKRKVPGTGRESWEGRGVGRCGDMRRKE